ncbi:unnamed protein product [Adineta steineri]|uniref:Uncharacterized protein n=1 Tax=Adineta steineri TaxID=433720 RepID=A0A819VJ90_9BILA|nr:unnamed protein product [Adineta steineri]CAF4109676.1 unnamed protein product [Adineta steineri]
MSTIVSSKISYFENYKKQFDSINEELNAARISESNHLSDRIRYLISYNEQIEIAHNDINNKYQEKEMIDNEFYQLSNVYTQQNYNRFIQMNKQEVNDMKSLLTFSRELIVKYDDAVPERSKSQYSRKEGAADIDTEQH